MIFLNQILNHKAQFTLQNLLWVNQKYIQIPLHCKSLFHNFYE